MTPENRKSVEQLAQRIEEADGAFGLLISPEAGCALRNMIAALSQAEEYRDALEMIAEIEDDLWGGDWDEIERARVIANEALGITKEKP